MGGPHLKTSSPAAPNADLVRAVKQAEAQFIADQLDTVVRAATPTRQVTKKTIRHKDGTVTTVVTVREVSDWRAAWRLLEAKAPEEFGGNRLDLKKLKKEMADLERRFRALLEGKYPELVALLDRRAGAVPSSAPPRPTPSRLERAVIHGQHLAGRHVANSDQAVAPAPAAGSARPNGSGRSPRPPRGSRGAAGSPRRPPT